MEDQPPTYKICEESLRLLDQHRRLSPELGPSQRTPLEPIEPGPRSRVGVRYAGRSGAVDGRRGQDPNNAKVWKDSRRSDEPAGRESGEDERTRGQMAWGPNEVRATQGADA